jgi:hypothetical protein
LGGSFAGELPQVQGTTAIPLTGAESRLLIRGATIEQGIAMYHPIRLVFWGRLFGFENVLRSDIFKQTSNLCCTKHLASIDATSRANAASVAAA